MANETPEERKRLLATLHPEDRELVEGIMADHPGVTAARVIEECDAQDGLRRISPKRRTRQRSRTASANALDWQSRTAAGSSVFTRIFREPHMRDQVHGYTPAEVDQLIIRMFFEWPSESFVARQLGLSERAVEAALERFVTQVAALANVHWRERLLRQVDDLILCCDRLSEVEDPPRISVAMRVRLAALRTSFLAAAETPTPEPTPAPARAVAAVARQPPPRRGRRLDSAAVRTHTPELAAAE